MDIDQDKIDDVVLALLWFNLATAGVAWKGFEWSAMSRLHRRGLISNPVSKNKSVTLTDEGKISGERLLREFFARA